MLVILIATTTVSTLASVVTASLAFVPHVEARALRAELDAKWAEATKPRAPASATPTPSAMTDEQRHQWFRETEPTGPLPSSTSSWAVHNGDEPRVVTRALLDQIPAVDGARIVPSLENGKPIGFKIFSIRPVSVYAQLGLQNGDTVLSINGLPLSSPDAALAAYAQLKEARSFELDMRRRGQALRLEYVVEGTQP